MPAVGGGPSRLGGRGLRTGGFSKGNGHTADIVAQCEQIKNIDMGRGRAICRAKGSRYRVSAVVSVVIPTLNAERTLAQTLAALVPAVVESVVQEAIVVDGGSTDGTRAVAEAAGTHLIEAGRGRGAQLEAGASAARGDWLLFLHADTVIEPGWVEEAQSFTPGSKAAGVARLRPRSVSRSTTTASCRVSSNFWWGCAAACWRCPMATKGLSISRHLYRRLGGFRPLPLMEDVDLVRRLKRRELVMLKSRAVTSGERYRREGYMARSLRNLGC